MGTAGGTGVELWAWVDADSDTAADARWTTLTNALSGLFCASLNFLDSTRTIRPVLSFSPEGDHSPAQRGRLHLLHGALPREPVCTENLTPFLKLLPCKGRAGVASLLDGHRLFDAQWQSMSVVVKPVCSASGCVLQVEQRVDMVLDVARTLQKRDSPVPKPRPVDQLSCDPDRPYAGPDACFPRENLADLAWSIWDLFGRPVRGACPLAAARPAVCVDVPRERDIYASQGSKEELVSGTRCYVLPAAVDFDLLLPSSSPPLPIPLTPPPLYASRSFTGHGQERGGVQAVLTNPSLTDSVGFIYLDSLPWFMKPYLHTLRLHLSPPSPLDPLLSLHYRPVLDRRRGAHLEAALHITS